jgi:hypothetical protein
MCSSPMLIPLSVPRSQGCRICDNELRLKGAEYVIMNCAVISFTSKRHSTTDD